MPALVKSNVGSLAGNKGDERTRVCPRCSKYLKKVSRISFPVINQSSVVSRRWSVDNSRVTRRSMTDSSLACRVWLNETDFIDVRLGLLYSPSSKSARE